MKYKIYYACDGRGHCFVEADSEEEAEESFYNGYGEHYEDDSDSYEISKIEKVKN